MCILLAIIICIGLATRGLSQALPRFVVEHFGDALWTVAAFLGMALLFPRWSSIRLGVLAFAMSVAIECSQLIDWSWLNSVRSTSIGHLLLGSGFVWIDLVRYFCGAVVATVLDQLWASRRRA